MGKADHNNARGCGCGLNVPVCVLALLCMVAITVQGSVITQQPFARTVGVSNTATFSVTATGPSPLTYQWLFKGALIPGATNAILTLTNVQLTHEGGGIQWSSIRTG